MAPFRTQSPCIFYLHRLFALLGMHQQGFSPQSIPSGHRQCDALSEPSQSDRQSQRELGKQWDAIHGRLVTCRPDELHPHPSYVRYRLTVPTSKLSTLAERGNLTFLEPLVIARDHTIVDGYARWELARQQGRPTLPCIEHELTDAEALNWLLQKHR